MTPSDPPPEPLLTRRDMRRRTASGPIITEAESAADAASRTEIASTAPTPTVTPSGALPAMPPADTVPTTTRALTWIREDGTSTAPAADATAGTELVEHWPRRSLVRPGVLVPVGIAAGLALVYAIAMLVWPLYAVEPEVEASELQTASGAAASPAWPAEGSAALSVDGVGTTASSSTDAVPMASITKLITALVVLDSMPLSVGESGPDYAFTRADRTEYYAVLASGESALDVPVGGTLTQYELLEGMLMGSAGNYADRLVDAIYPSDTVYARAAMQWLSDHGLSGITVVDSSGISASNTATPEALVALARRALANPVIAEIVAKKSVELPGAGLVENTNILLGEDGIVGVKTGLLNGAYNLLAARDITIGETTVRAYAVVLGQPDSDTRFNTARDLLASLDAQLAPTVALPAGSVVGTVSTLWSDPVDIVTATDASVILWNGSPSSGTADLELGDDRESGASVGTATVTGPADTAQVEAQLAAEVPGPSAWWRLTHPLELMGLV